MTTHREPYPHENYADEFGKYSICNMDRCEVWLYRDENLTLSFETGSIYPEPRAEGEMRASVCFYVSDFDRLPNIDVAVHVLRRCILSMLENARSSASRYTEKRYVDPVPWTVDELALRLDEELKKVNVKRVPSIPRINRKNLLGFWVLGSLH